MKHFYLTPLLAATAACGLLAACTDDGYDLSDIDTTSEFTVNNLTVPVNLDELRLSAIIDLKENETVKLIDGEYCIVQENEFESKPVKIDPVTLTASPITPSSKTFDLSQFSDSGLPAGVTVPFDLSSRPSGFNVSTSAAPECLKRIDNVAVEMEVTMTLSLLGFGNNLKHLDIENIVLLLPKGLSVTYGPGSYDEATGKYSIAKVSMQGASGDIKIGVGAIDCAKAGVVLDYARHTIDFDGELGIESAVANMTRANLTNPSDIPSEVIYKTEYHVSDIKLKSFSGALDYDIDDLDIPRVSLGDLPDVLSQKGTNLSLTNPRLYLSIYNPLAAANVGGSLDIDIVSYGNNPQPVAYPMHNPLTINPKPSASYCLSPEDPETAPEGFPDPEWHRYADLGKVLEGDGLPESLEIKAVDPRLLGEEVRDMKIGEEYPAVKGSYYLLAPLAFDAGSHLAYSDVADGWADEDLDKLLIKSMTVTAKVTSDVPVALNFEAWPVGRDGERIGNVEIEGAVLPAATHGSPVTDYPLTIHVTGEVQGIDGIRYKATALTEEDARALSENMHIILKEVRATVSGTYTTDF